jgi:hypothetical protein
MARLDWIALVWFRNRLPMSNLISQKPSFRRGPKCCLDAACPIHHPTSELPSDAIELTELGQLGLSVTLPEPRQPEVWLDSDVTGIMLRNHMGFFEQFYLLHARACNFSLSASVSNVLFLTSITPRFSSWTRSVRKLSRRLRSPLVLLRSGRPDFDRYYRARY